MAMLSPSSCTPVELQKGILTENRARITNLYVPDKSGKPQDIVVGYDDGHQYLLDTLTNHTYFGPIVGLVLLKQASEMRLGRADNHLPAAMPIESRTVPSLSTALPRTFPRMSTWVQTLCTVVL